MSVSSETPPRPKRRRIFYGWYIIGVSSVGGFFAGATSQAFFGVFVRPIEDETGWSRTAIAGAITVATFAGGATTAFVGRMADRWGPRYLMTAGVLLYGLGYAGMSLVTQIWHLYLAYLMARIAALHFLSGVVPRTAAVNWFRRMRGRALGLQTTAMPLGGSILAAIAGVLLALGMDWRSVFLLFGLLAMGLLVVPIPLVMRRQPEDMGLLPDGDSEVSAAVAPVGGHGHGGRRLPAGPEVSWTLRQARSSRALWLITLAMLFGTWAGGGLAFHLPAYYTDIGLGAGVAGAAASAYLLSGALSSSLWGFLSERFAERKLAVGATVTATLLMIIPHFVTEPVLAVAFPALLGAVTRGENALLVMMLASYYGRRNFGAISGYASQFSFFGLAAGPIVFSLMFDTTGDYTGVFFAAAILLASSVVCLWFAHKPVLQETPAS